MEFQILVDKSTNRPVASNLNAGLLFIPYDVGFPGALQKPEIWLSDGRSWRVVLAQMLAKNVGYSYTINGNTFTNVDEALTYILQNLFGYPSSPDVLIDCGTIANPNDNVVIDCGAIT